ncbi:MAG: hypothetical protein KJO49_11495 [Bacteroidia bacterium]|nr:hypothetical protein [Bacteroidia bacterium]
MKHLIFFLALFISVGLEAQTNDAFVQNNATALNVAAQGNIRSQGSSAYFVNPPREIEGSVHLFDNWNNRAVIYTVDNQQYLMKNINLNLQRHTFESKIAQDTLFTFNFNNIDKFVVNNKVYRNYYWDDDNRVYEVIYDGKDYQVIKGFKLEIIEGSANPMLNRRSDKYAKKEAYYIRKEGKIKPFRLSKGRIMKLFKSDEEKSKELLQFVRENKLSFKKEYDIRRLLEFSDSI